MKTLLLSLAILFSMTVPSLAEDNPCLAALPKDGNGAVYNRLRASSFTDLHYLLDEYVYQMNFSTHDEALHAGLDVGAIVYGVPLKIGGVFDKSNKDQWRSEYEQKRKVQFTQTKLSTLEVAKLDPSVISVIASGCMQYGIFSTLRPTDDCHFKFRAGYRSDKRGGENITPVQLTVRGGQCDNWPNKMLAPGGDEITCTRSGRGAVDVVLDTKEVGSTSQTFPVLEPHDVPPEPKIVEQLSEQITQDVAVDGWLSHAGPGDRGCPDCKTTFYNDFAPNLKAYPDSPDASAIIAAVSTARRSGTCSHWIQCPDGGGCGVAEFTSVSDSGASCIGQGSCRLWRMTNGSRACTDTIHVSFYLKKKVCQDCGGKDWASAHSAWEKAKQQADAQSCPALPDKKPQVIGTRRR